MRVKIAVSLQEFGKLKFTLRYDIYNMSEGGAIKRMRDDETLLP